MSQENVELVREIIAAVPDWDQVSALLHPDACFDQTRIPGGGAPIAQRASKPSGCGVDPES